jgi:hypothetical protein
MKEEAPAITGDIGDVLAYLIVQIVPESLETFDVVGRLWPP